MSRNIDEIITAYGQDTGDIASSSKARAELASLRSDLKTARVLLSALDRQDEPPFAPGTLCACVCGCTNLATTTYLGEPCCDDCDTP